MTILPNTRFSAFSRVVVLGLSAVLWAIGPTGSSRAEPSSASDEAPVEPVVAENPSPAATLESAPAAPPVRTVPVHFTATRGRLQVEAVGPTPNRCNTPCTLLLVPGKTDLLISGDASFGQSLEIPNHETSVELSTRRRRRAITGGVFTLIGLVAAGVSIATMNGALAPSLGVCVTGLVASITGFVLVRRSGHNGARIIEDERQVAQSKARKVSFAGVGIAPMLSQAGARVSTGWTF